MLLFLIFPFLYSYLFYPHISRPITHPSSLLLPPRTMCKTSNGKIKTTFISRATIGDGEMSHIVTATFCFFVFFFLGWRWRQLSADCLQQGAESRHETGRHVFFFFGKAFCGHVVSLSPPPGPPRCCPQCNAAKPKHTTV